MFKNITSFKDINEILQLLTKGIQEIFGGNLVGFYLMGSLTYGDFNADRSDIDLLAILTSETSGNEIKAIKKLHLKAEEKYPKWAKRIECQYVPIKLFKNILPPKQPRPYYGEGILYPKARYGNEWLINNHLLYQHGIVLYGKNFKSLVKPINFEEVKKACIRDLFKEWQPKITDPTYLNNPHYQAYVILNLCRILYAVLDNKAGSKKAAAEFTKKKFKAWENLIQKAEEWQYGKTMNHKEETKKFISFAINKVRER